MESLTPKLGWRKLTAWFLTFAFTVAATFYSMSLAPESTQPDMPSNLRDVFMGVTLGFFAMNGWEWWSKRGQK